MKGLTAILARLVLLGAAMTLAGTAHAQQDYPTKAIRIIVPYAPGAITDILARIVGKELTTAWGQPVIIDNRPGGNTGHRHGGHGQFAARRIHPALRHGRPCDRQSPMRRPLTTR